MEFLESERAFFSTSKLFLPSPPPPPSEPLLKRLDHEIEFKYFDKNGYF